MKRIPLTQGAFAMIDDGDYELVSGYSWQLCNGYARTTERVRKRKRTIYMHRLIMGLRRGDTRQVDHINHDTLDNRRSNLRLCTGPQNHRNAQKRSHNRSGFLGVSWDRTSERWVAQISHHGRTRKIGRFDDPERAARAYDRKAIELHGRFASTNFPRSDYE